MPSEASPKRVLSFGDYRLDTRSGELFRDGSPVKLPPQPCKLLLLLASAPGELISREEIQIALWPNDTFVDFEQGINKCIKQVRAALEEDAGRPVYIQTVSRRGYRFLVPVRVESPAEKNPYPGLSPFTETDTPFFFGREEEVRDFWRKIERNRLLALIGPSGAGKTSFLRAGLVPCRPEGFRARIITPGDSPLESLSRWSSETGSGLLVVDAFEEIFTLHPPAVQREYADSLGRIAREQDVHVVLSMRDDFLMRCHEHENLAPIFRELTPLSAPTGRALRRALVQPAAACGYSFEDEELVSEMVAAVENERGALPLLAFAAARLWDQRDRERRLLTRKAYEEIGRVEGALARHAESTLQKIGHSRAPLVRELLRNLVTAEGTRASRATEDLLSMFAKPEDRSAAESVLRELAAARLMTTYEGRLEIIHESLLSRWPRLVKWRTEDADGALLRDQLVQAARLWDEKGRTPDLLWTGSARDELRLWRERYPGRLTAVEEEFTGSMEKEARRRRRRKRLALAAAFLSISAVAIAIGFSRREALKERDRAEASKLLALAELRLEEDPTEALAFATASLELADSEEARRFAVKALWEGPPARELVANSQAVRAPVFSPDGKWLATAGHATEALVWSEEGNGPIVLPGHETSPRGPNLAQWTSKDLLVTGPEAMIGSRVHLWSLPEGRRIRTIDFGGPSYWQVGSERLFAETLEGATDENRGLHLLRSWPLPGGEAVLLGRVDRRGLGAHASFFTPDGQSWLYAKDRSVHARPLPFGNGQDRPFARLEGEVIDFWNAADDLFVADRGGATHVWSFPAGRPARATRSTGLRTPRPRCFPIRRGAG